MSEKKNICPVCFTKLQPKDNVLVCPECGYKLCDHSYTYHASYSTEHTHTPDYTTAYKSGNSTPRTASAPTAIPTPAASAPQLFDTSLEATRARARSGEGVKLTKGGKIAIAILVIYAGMPIFMSIVYLIFSVLSELIHNL